MIIFTVKHHLVRCGLSQANRHLISQNNTLNHWSHTNTTLHMLKENNSFHTTTDGPSAPLAVKKADINI